MVKTKKKYNVSMAIVVSMVLGVVAGFIGGETMENIKFLGDIFFRLIQMIIIPLVMLQIIEAIGGISDGKFGRTGIKAVFLFVISSLAASAFGAFMAYVFKPGMAVSSAGLSLVYGEAIEVGTKSFQETISAFFPNNIINAMSTGSMIQVIVFSIFFGVALGKYRSKNSTCKIYELVCELNELLINIVKLIMNIAPIGIFAYVSATVGVLGIDSMIMLLKYLLVFGAAVFVFMVLWIIIVSLYAKMNILKLIKKMIPMSFMALATTSSAVTLPLEMEDSKKKLGISDKIANIVLPLGMPLNSNGAAMHMAITAVMIAQMYSIYLSPEKMVYLVIISLLLSLANAVVPGAALVSLTMVVPQLGLPLESIAIFAGVEWIIGMYRTILNVDSDVFCAILVAKSENEIDYNVFNS